MSEIEKMYENAGIKKEKTYYFPDDGTQQVWSEDYPTFTAEKQIELIKGLAQKDCYCCNYTEIKPRDNNNEWMSHSVFKTGYAHTFEESLANLINALWQDLTSEEKQQVKGILE